jgi:chromosomal replication initiation ATPase DnaA
MCRGNELNMKKLEYFGKVLEVVTDLTEVESNDIVGKNRAVEVIDARWLAIKLMRDKGYSTRQIASLFNRSTRSITHALLFFENRTEDPFSALGNIYETARQILRNSGETTH